MNFLKACSLGAASSTATSPSMMSREAPWRLSSWRSSVASASSPPSSSTEKPLR